MSGGEGEFILLVKINDRIVQASDSTTQTVHLGRSCTWSVVCRLVMVAGEGETTTVAFSTTERQPHPQQPSQGDAKHPSGRPRKSTSGRPRQHAGPDVAARVVIGARCQKADGSASGGIAPSCPVDPGEGSQATVHSPTVDFGDVSVDFGEPDKTENQ